MGLSQDGVSPIKSSRTTTIDYNVRYSRGTTPHDQLVSKAGHAAIPYMDSWAEICLLESSKLVPKASWKHHLLDQQFWVTTTEMAIV